MPYVVGLTGGIGCGKSTVSDILAALDTEIIDADVIARELVAPGTPALAAITGHFGTGILRDGALDRKALRAIIFQDENARHWLEALLHPLIREEIRQRISQSTAPWLVISVPLLLQSADYDFVDSILYVDCSPEQQRARVMQRDRSSAGEVERIIASQTPRSAALERADLIIHNTGSLQALETEVKRIHEHYQRTAANRGS